MTRCFKNLPRIAALDLAPGDSEGNKSSWLSGNLALRIRLSRVVLLGAVCCSEAAAHAGSVTNHPYQGVTKIVRTETSPRNLHINVMQIDLTAPGLRFAMTPGSGARETTALTTLNYMIAQQAQIGINACFYQPNSTDATRWIVGLAASAGNIYSSFEGPTPSASNPVNSLTLDQSYAILYYAPALNIDSNNNAQIVHYDSSFADKKHVLEPVTLYNAICGSAQTVTTGTVTIPTYTGNPATGLTPSSVYSNAHSWYNDTRSRTAVGLSADNHTLTLFTVDEAGGSAGMMIGEVANMLKNDYGVYNALSLDGGGSTTMTMQDPVTRANSIINTSSDNPAGRSVANSLLVFATNQPPTVAISSPTNGATVGTNFTIQAVAADDWAVTNVSFYDGSTLLGSGSTNPYNYPWTSASAGSHALTAVARDNVGLSTTSAVVNITVALPPSISCPADITMAATGPGGAVVVYPDPTVSGGVPPLTTNCVPASGATFPIGTTVVTCTVSDSSVPPQSTNCTFNVTVQPLVPTVTLTNFMAGSLDAQFTLSGTTDIAGNVVTEKTTSLAPADWVPYQTNPVPGGPFSFTIPQPADSAAFFRLRGQ